MFFFFLVSFQFQLLFLNVKAIKRNTWFIFLSFVFSFSLALTKLDILDVFSEIKVGLAYKVDGEIIPHFPGKCLKKEDTRRKIIPHWFTYTFYLTDLSKCSSPNIKLISACFFLHQWSVAHWWCLEAIAVLFPVFSWKKLYQLVAFNQKKICLSRTFNYIFTNETSFYCFSSILVFFFLAQNKTSNKNKNLIRLHFLFQFAWILTESPSF